MQSVEWLRMIPESSNYLKTSWTEITESGMYVFNSTYNTFIKVWSDNTLSATFGTNLLNSNISMQYDTIAYRYLEKGQWIKSNTTQGNYTRLEAI